MPRLIRSRPHLTMHSLHYIQRERLLDTKICDLPLSLERHWVKKNITKLYRELRLKGIKFKPHIWISDDWFSPDGIAGFAVPFFILHPRLIDLEIEMIGEAEGANPKWCMQLLRHETGHALDNAFHLRKNKLRQSIFGLTSIPYPDSYLPNPRSKEFVRHLNGHYAQAHPDEDWAETFAIWLTPRSGWRTKYRHWPALAKLELIDEMMNNLKGKMPQNLKKEEAESYASNQLTLREYYRKKRIKYGLNKTPMFKRDLKKLFSAHGTMPAWKFIHNHKNQIVEEVAKETDIQLYKVRKIVVEIQKTCREEQLRYPQPLADKDLQAQKKDQLIHLIMDNTDRFFKERSSHIIM